MSLSGKRRKGKVMTPEQEGIFRDKLKALSPAELEMLRDMAQASIMKAHKVTDVDGKKVRAHICLTAWREGERASRCARTAIRRAAKRWSGSYDSCQSTLAMCI